MTPPTEQYDTVIMIQHSSASFWRRITPHGYRFHPLSRVQVESPQIIKSRTSSKNVHKILMQAEWECLLPIVGSQFVARK